MHNKLTVLHCQKQSQWLRREGGSLAQRGWQDAEGCSVQSPWRSKHCQMTPASCRRTIRHERQPSQGKLPDRSLLMGMNYELWHGLNIPRICRFPTIRPLIEGGGCRPCPSYPAPPDHAYWSKRYDEHHESRCYLFRKNQFIHPHLWIWYLTIYQGSLDHDAGGGSGMSVPLPLTWAIAVTRAAAWSLQILQP